MAGHHLASSSMSPFSLRREYTAAKWEKVGEEVKTPVVSRETLIAMKRSAARPQDFADIAELEKIEKLKQSVSK